MVILIQTQNDLIIEQILKETSIDLSGENNNFKYRFRYRKTG